MADIALDQLETQIQEALSRRDVTDLTVLGFGELSVALAVSTADGEAVAKRTPPFRQGEFAPYRTIVEKYVSQLTQAGVPVVSTEVEGVNRPDGSTIAYLIQPLLAADTIGGDVLRNQDPVEDHPFLVAIGEHVIRVADGSLSIDAQVTNWSWDGGAATLVDVGTPMVWKGDGSFEMDMDPFIRMLPAPFRPLIKREMTKVTQRWRTASGTLTDAVGNLYRENLEEWTEPAAATWSRQLIAAGHEPASVEGARKAYEDDLKLWPMLKRLQRLERRWCKLRGRPYDYFIQNSYDGSLS